jgi:CRP-like cAMP-binding protein
MVSCCLPFEQIGTPADERCGLDQLSRTFFGGDLEEPGTDALCEKLSRFVALNKEEQKALRRLSRNAKWIPRGTDLIREGDKPVSVFLLLEGWAFRYKSLVEGNRQIMAYLLPGDCCDVRKFFFEEIDHSIGLLCEALVAQIPAAEMLDVMNRYPRIERAMMWATLVDEATLREWLLNVGQRNALQRIAHLFCELCVRLRVVHLVDVADGYALPLTQIELADTTGMTTVHVNRSLQRLRKDGLIATRRGKLTILDLNRLAELAGFDPTYLHVGGPPVEEKHRSHLSTHL